jgi:hypothetical protein
VERKGKERKVPEARSTMKVAVGCSSPQTNNLGLGPWPFGGERGRGIGRKGKNGL